MSNLYVETSAVAAWLLGESSAKSFSEVVGKANNIGTSRLTLIETERALIRALHQKKVSDADRNRMRGLFSKTVSEWHILEITKEIQKRASESFPVEPIRSLDAIHLATLIQWAIILPGVIVVTLDNRIIQNAKPLGFHTASLTN